MKKIIMGLMMTLLAVALVSASCENTDLNSDGYVDVSDVLVLRNNWGKTSNRFPLPCEDNGLGCTEEIKGDINQDGIVNAVDVLILRECYNADMKVIFRHNGKEFGVSDIQREGNHYVIEFQSKRHILNFLKKLWYFFRK